MIHFESEPQGAKVLIDGIEVCKTPCTTPVTRSLTDQLVEFKLDGYETRIITLSREFNVVSVLNLGNLLGWGIDAATGALMVYDRKSYEIELEKDDAVSIHHPHQIEIDTQQRIVEVFVIEQ
ncbi:MAG: PEGA domain-containing protein [Bacteroidetes bacterium]|nr:MAG: PEGA domain-containing protein [Bacteroidota bacterium]